MSKRSIEWKRITPYVFVFMCALLMSLQGTNNPFYIGRTGTDSSVFHYVARVILRGGMPYRDTFDHKGPLIYLIDALGLLINENIGVWIIELFTIFVVFLFAYKIARLLGCNYLSSCITVAIGVFVLAGYFEGGNFTEEYACVFIIISLFLFLKFFAGDTIGIHELVLCGASFASVCMLRINMVALWGIMCIGVLIDRIRKKKAKDLLRFIVWFMVGAAVVAIPILIWLLKNNAFDAFIHDYFIFNFMYSSDAERASFSNVLSTIKYFVTGSPVILSVTILAYFCTTENKMTDWLCLIAMGLSVVMLCISGQKYGHYGMILYPLIIYCIARLFSKFDSIKDNFDKKTRVGLVISFFCIVGLLFSTEIMNVAKTTIKLTSHKDGEMNEMRQIAQIVQSGTNIDEKITVCGNCDIIYLLSNRDSVSKYSYQDPLAKISSEIEKEYFEDIEKLSAKMIVANSENEFLYSRIKTITNEHYRLIDTVGKYEIYLLE